MNGNNGHPPFRALVVGGDGLVGQALTAHLRARNWHVVATTRRRALVSEARPFLDLDQGNEDWSQLREQCFDVAYLVAAVARLANCARDPEGSWRINVVKTTALAAWLMQRGVRVVFLSTNQVFDGQQAHRREDEPVAPATVYGRQKAATEMAIMTGRPRAESATVVRLTKVLGDTTPLFDTWGHSLLADEQISPFLDMTLAPVHTDLVVRCLELVGGGKGDGIYQLSATHDLSYAAVGKRLAERMGKAAGLVRPVSWCEAAILAEPPALNTTLDVSRLIREFGITPPNPWDAIERSLDSTIARIAATH